jgi:cobalt/nickel transport system ATP-binding protein
MIEKTKIELKGKPESSPVPESLLLEKAKTEADKIEIVSQKISNKEQSRKNLVVEVENLSYTFPDGTVALTDISFTVLEKEKVVIIGPNGAGKSTLLLLLDGLIDGRGSIKILGQEVKRKSARKIRPRVGLVFQNPDDQLFMPTVLDDVAFGLSNTKKLKEGWILDKVKTILRELKAEHLLYRSTMKLSLGEKKKVALAGVLVMEPEILLLDEPTSGLDPAGRRWLVSYLQNLDRTLVITTHNLEFAQQVGSRFILINQGRVVASGRKEEILDNKELLLANGL